MWVAGSKYLLRPAFCSVVTERSNIPTIAAQEGTFALNWFVVCKCIADQELRGQLVGCEYVDATVG